jgi:hypothetical protein
MFFFRVFYTGLVLVAYSLSERYFCPTILALMFGADLVFNESREESPGYIHFFSGDQQWELPTTMGLIEEVFWKHLF